MAGEPSYPNDVPVTPAKGPASDEPAAPPPHGAKAEDARAGAKSGGEDRNRGKHLMTGAAIGIGSAALVAALLYSGNRAKSNKQKGEKGGNG